MSFAKTPQPRVEKVVKTKEERRAELAKLSYKQRHRELLKAHVAAGGHPGYDVP